MRLWFNDQEHALDATANQKQLSIVVVCYASVRVLLLAAGEPEDICSLHSDQLLLRSLCHRDIYACCQTLKRHTTFFFKQLITTATPALYTVTLVAAVAVTRGGVDAKCELCVPGLSTPNAFRTACDCVPGTYLAPDEDGTHSSGVTKNCVRCAEGSISSTTNAKSCIQCPAGTSPGKNNKCNCPTGYHATAVDENGATGCTKCDEGLVSPGGLATTCTACPDFSVPLPSGDYCGCLPGTKLESSEPFSCAACATVFEYTESPNRLMTCQQCYPFSYATKNHTACECTGGYYAINPDAMPVRCTSCPKGTYKSGSGNDPSLCIKCPEGLEPSGSGRQCGEWAAAPQVHQVELQQQAACEAPSTGSVDVE